MAKLDALKEKIALAQNSLGEKLDKIALFKKWREQRAKKNGPAVPNASIGTIYRQGGVGTRLQVILLLLFLGAGSYFTFQAGRKIFARFGKSAENEKLKADYSHGLGALSSQVAERASLISMGKFTANVFSSQKKGLMAVDVWIRLSEPTAAEFAQKNETLFYDGIVTGFSNAYRSEIDPLTNDGNIATKNLIRDALNKLLPKGKVEEVFFQNLIVQ